MSGLQVLAALRSDPATASLGVVALSASAEADDMQCDAREAGAIGVPDRCRTCTASTPTWCGRWGGGWRPDEARQPCAASACSQVRKAPRPAAAWRGAPGRRRSASRAPPSPAFRTRACNALGHVLARHRGALQCHAQPLRRGVQRHQRAVEAQAEGAWRALVREGAQPVRPLHHADVALDQRQLEQLLDAPEAVLADEAPGWPAARYAPRRAARPRGWASSARRSGCQVGLAEREVAVRVRRRQVQRMSGQACAKACRRGSSSQAGQAGRAMHVQAVATPCGACRRWPRRCRQGTGDARQVAARRRAAAPACALPRTAARRAALRAAPPGD